MLYDNEPMRRKSSTTDLQATIGRMQRKTASSTKSSSSTSTSSASSRRNKCRWDQPEPSHSTGSLLSSMERFVRSVDDMNETILIPCRLMDLTFDETFKSGSGSHKGHTGQMTTSGGLPPTPKRSSGSSSSKKMLSNMNGVDLYQFYNVLNNIKNDLMWGRLQQNPTIPAHAAIMPTMAMSSVSSASSSGGLSTSSSSASVISSMSIGSAGSRGSGCSSSTGGGLPVSEESSTNNSCVGGSTKKGHARRPSTVSTTSSASASDTEFSELNEDSGVEDQGSSHDPEDSKDQAQAVADTFHHHLNGLQQCLGDLTLAADYVTNRYNSALGVEFGSN